MEHIQILIDAVNESAKMYTSLGDYSATQLIDAPRPVTLRKRYGHLSQPTLQQQIASFMGTALHRHFEYNLRKVNAKYPDYILEQSVTVPMFLNEMGTDYRLVSGTFDILHKREDIYDIKTVNVWKKVFDPNMIEWTRQQNIYAWLLRQRGVLVKSINIIAVYKDWLRHMSLRDSNYPKDQVCLYPLRLWDEYEQEAYIRDRLNLHVKCETLNDGALPDCTQEERWEREKTVYALMKDPRAKRAMCLCDTLEQVVKEVHSRKVTDESFVEVRPAKRVRCEDWCTVNKWCNSWQTHAKFLADTTHWLIPVSQLGR